jgi:hypothetical protein
LDEYSRKLISEPSIDHIVPVDSIVVMDGWEKLPKETQKRLLSRTDNLRLMEKKLNSSKGAKSWSEWSFGKEKYGGEIWNKMIQEERELYTKIQKDILDSLPR